jgi:hypothetical protein
VSGDERSPQAASLSGENEIPRALVEGELEILGLMPNASNATFLARARAGDDQVLAVYKPERGESPLWDFPEGTLHRREVAAYELSRALGWPDIPPTVLRDGPAGEGSVQLFVRFDPDVHFFHLEMERGEEFRRFALFDLVANNADRKAGHCLLGPDGTIWGIDHGVCFAEEPKLRTVIWTFAGEAIPDGLAADLAGLAVRLEAGDAGRILRDLLSEGELVATRARVAALLEAGVFPEPDADRRPFPWPPI